MEISVDGLLAAARERFNNRDYYGALLCLDDLAGEHLALGDQLGYGEDGLGGEDEPGGGGHGDEDTTAG